MKKQNPLFFLIFFNFFQFYNFEPKFNIQSPKSVVKANEIPLDLI